MQHHFGVQQSLHFVWQVDVSVTHAEVEAVVCTCPNCASVDPAPTQWDRGELSVAENLWWIMVDIMHFGKDHFLTMVDCGPSCFAIWQKLTSENALVVEAVFEQVFHK